MKWRPGIDRARCWRARARAHVRPTAACARARQPAASMSDGLPVAARTCAGGRAARAPAGNRLSAHRAPKHGISARSDLPTSEQIQFANRRARARRPGVDPRVQISARLTRHLTSWSDARPGFGPDLAAFSAAFQMGRPPARPPARTAARHPFGHLRRAARRLGFGAPDRHN